MCVCVSLRGASPQAFFFRQGLSRKGRGLGVCGVYDKGFSLENLKELVMLFSFALCAAQEEGERELKGVGLMINKRAGPGDFLGVTRRPDSCARLSRPGPASEPELRGDSGVFKGVFKEGSL